MEALVEYSVARNHLATLQCDYQVIDVEAILTSHKPMCVLIGKLIYISHILQPYIIIQ